MYHTSFIDIEILYSRDEHLKREDVAELQKWYQQQPHLPGTLHPLEAAMHLHSTHYSVEAGKQFINESYTFRTQNSDVFLGSDPFAPEVQRTMNSVILTTLPHLSPEGNLMFYSRFQDRDSEAFDFNNAVKWSIMTIELAHLQRGYFNGATLIFDLEGSTLRHLLKCNLFTVKKLLYYTKHVSPVFVRSIHFVNSVPFMDKILSLFRHSLESHLQNALHVHFDGNSTIFKFLPKELIPIECGGSYRSATEYYRNVTRKNIEENAEYFKWHATRVVDESKRRASCTDYGDFFGVDGHFKALGIN